MQISIVLLKNTKTAAKILHTELVWKVLKTPSFFDHYHLINLF